MTQNINNHSFEKLITTLKTLFAEREWDQFHAPKNLAMNLMIEASELAEFFTWISEAQSHNISPVLKEKISDEVGDIFLTLVYLCDKLGIDIFQATFDKIEKIKKKYPVEQFKGRDTKFSVNLA
jgi:NTP pyrophosphatase (non-canonical NTP hydrolase)